VKLGEAMQHAERVLNQNRQMISSGSATEVIPSDEEETSIISDGTISDDSETKDQAEKFGSDETVESTHGHTHTTTTTSQSYCTGKVVKIGFFLICQKNFNLPENIKI